MAWTSRGSPAAGDQALSSPRLRHPGETTKWACLSLPVQVAVIAFRRGPEATAGPVAPPSDSNGEQASTRIESKARVGRAAAETTASWLKAGSGRSALAWRIPRRADALQRSTLRSRTRALKFVRSAPTCSAATVSALLGSDGRGVEADEVQRFANQVDDRGCERLAAFLGQARHMRREDRGAHEPGEVLRPRRTRLQPAAHAREPRRLEARLRLLWSG